jgi:predicted DNA-binding transcriptional regulator AlpA
MSYPSNHDDEYCTLPELALWLRVSERHVQRLLETGDGPPSIRLGRRIIFHRVAVQRWLDARTTGKTPPPSGSRSDAERRTPSPRPASENGCPPTSAAGGGDHERP